MTATLDPTYAAMLAPILAHPDEDCWRLQMADWFADNGDEARASFICVQCKLAILLAKYGEINDTHSLRRRENELLTENHGLRWAMPLLDTMGWSQPFAMVGSWTWKRGFISEITCTAADWLTHADDILAEHPVTSVSLTSMILPEEVGKECPKVPLRIWLESHLHRQWPRIKFRLPNPPYIRD